MAGRSALGSQTRGSPLLGFEEILLPLLEPAEIYVDKAGAEILGQMYTFPDGSLNNLGETIKDEDASASLQLPSVIGYLLLASSRCSFEIWHG